MAVTPTPCRPTGEITHGCWGEGPEELSGPRVWVETPQATRAWKGAMRRKNAWIFGERPIPSTGSGDFCFASQVRPGGREPHPASAINHDPSRQIRPSDYGPAHLHHGPLQLSLCLLPLRRPGKTIATTTKSSLGPSLARLAKIFLSLGIRKIRITGGEPLVARRRGGLHRAVSTPSA